MRFHIWCASSAEQGNLRAGICSLALVAVLLAPSIWMLATIPPLWRDLDAYNQVALSPGQSTAGGHGPLYGVVVRLPLFLGYEFERLAWSITANDKNFLQQLRVTDSGILLLVLGQHLALTFAGFSLIRAATRNFLLQLALALFFASNSLFYTFAHCVGSESLSLISILFLAASGLRLLREPGEPSARLWILFSLALLAAILTRYANLLLILVLPVTCATLAILWRSRNHWRYALISLAIGVGCIASARVGAEVLCRSAGSKYYSKSGFTFLWRISFLESINEPRRSELLDQVAARARSNDARQVIQLVREMLREGRPLHAQPIMEGVRAALARDGKPVRTRRIHEALNRAVIAFLLPPAPELEHAARVDFTATLQRPLTAATEYLFLTTGYYFDHRELMPEVAPLRTFRDYTFEDLKSIPAQRSYFHFWEGISLNLWLAIDACAATTLIILVWQRKRERAADLIYGLALVGAGLLMVLITALIGSLIPRYTMPLWTLLWSALIIFAGAIESALVRQRSLTKESPPAAVKPG